MLPLAAATEVDSMLVEPRLGKLVLLPLGRYILPYYRLLRDLICFCPFSYFSDTKI